MERYVSEGGGIYHSIEDWEKANKRFTELCTAPVTVDNIMEKSWVLDGAAEEISCDECYGNRDMIYDLASQLYTYFDGDMEKAKKFYEENSSPDDWGNPDIAGTIKCLKEIGDDMRI